MSDQESKVRKGNKTLEQRGSIYGPYRAGINTRRKLMDTMLAAYKKQHGKTMPKHNQEYLWDICNKLCRIAVCPNHIDSWHDVSNYAALIEADVKADGGI